ncbi:transposase [Pandoraea sputorum]|uniref:Transposase n=1 Tax=Pandoraea sputorum TaxID=93222 RepID=A0A5E5BLI0_9BURK|nr:transposase [Pandoraea sputorum]
MTEGYELYHGIAREHELVHLGCWAHVRRGFIKAEESVPKAARPPDLLATRFITMIGKLFAAEARSATWGPERRQRLRARYSTHILAVLQGMLVDHLSSVVPSSQLGRALHYMQGQWPKPVRYVENGNWPISNNLRENAIRPFVIGRKGWLFSDTVAGAHASANLYSLVETCKANGIDPYRYLLWLFKKLPLSTTADDFAALTPWSMPLAAMP